MQKCSLAAKFSKDNGVHIGYERYTLPNKISITYAVSFPTEIFV